MAADTDRRRCRAKPPGWTGPGGVLRMPADDGLDGMPTEDLAALLRDVQTLRAREGLTEHDLASRHGQLGFTISHLGPRRRPRLGR